MNKSDILYLKLNVLPEILFQQRKRIADYNAPNQFKDALIEDLKRQNELLQAKLSDVDSKLTVLLTKLSPSLPSKYENLIE